MVKFHAPTPADKTRVDELLVRGSYRGCDYSFTGLYVWNRAYNQRIARVDDSLVTHMCGRLGCSYIYPAGSEDIAAVIHVLEAGAAEKREPLRLVHLAPRQMTELERFFPGQFACTADRDGYDYLYEVERLAELGGKKLHAKRDHINHSIENGPTWTYGEVAPATLSECLEMDKEWYRRSLRREGDAEERDLKDEGIALRTAMEHHEELGLEGGLIRVYGEMVAFAIGDGLSANAYDVHFEKAYGELQGTYAMINRELTRRMRTRHPEIRYFNREDDIGVEDLHKARRNYYPDLMVEKHTAAMK